MDRTKRISVKDIPIGQVALYGSDERPIDYGHCKEIMADKYGEERAERMYESMIDGPSARFFQVATKILLEKKAMYSFLLNRGVIKIAKSWQELTYEELYDLWFPMRKS